MLIRAVEFASDLCGSHRLGKKRPDADLPGFDITAYWARSGLLSMTRDAGEPPTWPVAGSGDNATAVGLSSAIVTALYRRERTGKGSYARRRSSLRASGRQASDPGRAMRSEILRTARPKESGQCGVECVSRFGRRWCLLVVTPDKLPAVAKAIGRADLLTDPRFVDPAKLTQNMAQLTAIFDEVFCRNR